MYKYIGDSILNASFTVQVPKPLDNRTVVNNIHELYSIPATYAYLGMTVANIDNGNIYMLVDKTKISQKAGWKASYESIQILTCSYAEYKEWELNTNELFQPIDDTKEYLHQDTYYYIYEDSLPLGEINQEYVKRSDWQELLNQVATKASNNAVITINQTLAQIVNDYATKQFVIDGYAPLSMFNLENTESFIRTNFFTKDEALGKFVKFSDLSGGEELDEDDYIFVTASRYQTDQAALQQYKQDLAEELSHFLRVGDDGELGNVVISQIKSPVVNNEQLTVNVTPEGFKVGNDRFAMLSDVPPHVTLTRTEYELLVENDEVDEDTYYHVVGDDDTYVLESELVNYYTIAGVQSYIAGRTYSKAEIDEIISSLSFDTPDDIAHTYVTKTALADTLEDYVTIAMLGGEEGDEGTFIFVKQSDYNTYVTNTAQQRLQDLQDIDDTYLRKNQDGTLGDITATSVITQVITDGTNVLSIGDVLQFNDDEIALKRDVPKLVTLTIEEYQQLVENDEVEEDVYYHITNDTDTYVLASQLSDYYTKQAVQSYIAGRTYTKAEVDNLIARLSGYYTRDDIDDLFVSNNALQETLENYVTIAMLGGDDMEGQFIFVKASDYANDQQAAAQQREQDLQQIDSDYVKKDSDASLNSLETSTIKNGQNILSLSDILTLNNKKLALDEDVPVIQVVTQEEFEELTKDPNIYYFIYNTDPELAFVTAQELNNYYTKSQTDSKILEYINGGSAPTQLSELTEDSTHRTVTDTEKAAWNAKSDFSGSYDDLSDKPTIPSLAGYATETWVSDLINDILGIDANNIETLIDILNDEDTMTGILSVIAGKADKSELFSGSYNDLTDKPSIPTAQDKANWDGAVTALGGLSLVKLTQAEYDALVDKDANTLYIVT